MTFRKIKATDALKEHVTRRTEKFEKFVSYPIEVRVFLSVDKTYQCAEITVHAEHKEMVAVTKSKDMYESIDLAAHKIEAQLKKERERRKGHQAAHVMDRNGAHLGQDLLVDVPHREKRQKSPS